MEDKALKPDMFAQIEIQVQPESEAILLPREALIRSQNQDRVVLALGDGRFKSIAVRVGSSDADHYEILSGLQAGDEVVTSAQFLLDSESARHSDFQRMQDSALQHSSDKENVQTAEVTGLINTINVEGRLLNISRDGIKKWNRGPATMDFNVADDVPIGHLSAGTMVWFRFEISQGEFIIMDIKAQSPGAP